MNENILNYIRQYRNIYTREAITGELVRAGYQPAEIEAAWQTVDAAPSASPPPPWSGDLSQQPPGALPGQQPPSNPFYGEQTFGGTQSSFETQAQGSPPPTFEAQQTYSPPGVQPPPGWQPPPPGWQSPPGAQPPPGWQPPPPGTGPYYGPQMYSNVDPNGRRGPTYFAGRRSRQSQVFWSSFAITLVGFIFVVPYVSSYINIFILPALVTVGVIITSIVLWNRDREVARGVLLGFLTAIASSVAVAFLLFVVIAGICIVTGTTRF